MVWLIPGEESPSQTSLQDASPLALNYSLALFSPLPPCLPSPAKKCQAGQFWLSDWVVSLWGFESLSAYDPFSTSTSWV